MRGDFLDARFAEPRACTVRGGACVLQCTIELAVQQVTVVTAGMAKLVVAAHEAVMAVMGLVH